MSSVSDGLEPWSGQAGQVRVGHLIQGNRATEGDVWEVLEMRNPDQIEYGCGMWWRVVNLKSGEEAFIPPKQVNNRVTFMVPEAEFAECERSGVPPWQPIEWPSDAETVNQMVEQLGATLMATQDQATGEIWCPAYWEGKHHSEVREPGTSMRDEIEHMKIAHGLDTSGIEAMDADAQTSAVTKLHGRLHGPKQNLEAVKGGFPHRHVPEDHSKF